MDYALAAVGSAGKDKKKALLEQIDARALRPPVRKPVPGGQGPSEGHARRHHLGGRTRGLVGKMILADLASGRDLSAPIPDASAGQNLKRVLPAPAAELQIAQSKAVAAADQMERVEAAAVDDPELLGLKKKNKGKKFTEVAKVIKGSKKARAPNERFVVLGIVLSVEYNKWVAECMQLDERGEILQSSKTAGGKVRREALVWCNCENLNNILDAPPSDETIPSSELR
jgi:hypothetical protein